MHTLILGQTTTGKTTLAKIIAEQSDKSGRGPLVLDPLMSDWGKGAIVSHSSDELLESAKKTTNRVIVVDEALLALDKFDTGLNWLATTSRHLGHSAIFIGHRYKDVAPGLRSQVSQFFIFRSERDDAKELDNKFDAPILLTATRQPKWHFMRIVLDNGGETTIQRGIVNREGRKILLGKTINAAAVPVFPIIKPNSEKMDA